MKALCFGFSMLMVASVAAHQDDHFKPLFDGQCSSGWEGGCPMSVFGRWLLGHV